MHISLTNRFTARRQTTPLRALLGLTAGLCLLGRLAPVRAEQPSISVPTGGDIIQPEERYLLGPQDVLKVVVEEHPEYSDEEVIVPPDGLIVLPTGFSQQVIGHTKQTVQDAYKAWLAKTRLHNPRVNVGIKRMRPAGAGYVFVVGDVVAPGSIDIRKDFRITEVLARVGNVKGRLDEAEATLARRGEKKPIPVDLFTAISQPLSKANMKVQAGDVLTVHLIDPGIVSVNGDVKQPGIYQMRKAPKPGNNEIRLNSRLTDLLVVTGIGNIPAQGPGPGGGADARVERVGLATPNTPPPTAGNQSNQDNQDQTDISYTGFLIRKDAAGLEQRIPLDVEGALKNHGSDADIPLQPGDFVTINAIPPFNVWVNGNGYVGNSGKIKLARGAGVIEAIAQAGGLTKSTDKVSASIIRNRKVIPVDLDGLAKDNPILQDEDVLQLYEPNIVKVQITGAVTKPSGPEPLRLPVGARVLDAIAGAGGLTAAPETITINVLRMLPNGRQSPLKVDPISLVTKNDEAQNARLQDGDVVTISPIRKQVVYLAGQVNKPGSFELREGEGLAELITDAGGVQDNAALTRITIQRRGQEPQKVDIYDAIKLGQKLNFPLEDGDMVLVPQNESRVLVMEAVNKPGFVPIPERHSLTVLDAVNLAGGPQYGARTREVLLLRPVGNDKLQPHTISFDKFKQGDMRDNVVLQNGDIIAVPQGKVSGGFASKVLPLAGIFSLGKSLLGF